MGSCCYQPSKGDFLWWYWLLLVSNCMDLLDQCRYIPTMRWFGKQLLAVCEKR
ncbi:MAG: hypothetical protein RBS80_14285 [Thermoguttaceae bacterium]|jgi:hypothetical protein|nr:hypothetical protein [Thermoguttaceae bacterium]